ncbi:MAG: hypothetical protein BWX84_01717 [Verrucomicrobia bacterium ADurb.Bin118]|nr:MAG: hypothetical protein BWX84_01717 [Verrucomicrobia bacterium ADurb.Bin118]
MFLVKRLRDGERVLGAESEARVGFALEAGQIIKQRRELRARLALFRDHARLAETLGLDRFRVRLVPETLGFAVGVRLLAVLLDKFFVKPTPGVLPGGGIERADDFPKIPGHKLADFLLAFDQDRQCRRLDPAHGGFVEATELRVKRGHRARAVDAHQPVGLGAADGGVGKRLQVGIITQTGEALADGDGRHGLQPQPLDGLFRLGVPDDVAKDEFAFAPRVAGVDQHGHVGALDEFGELFQPTLVFRDGLQIKMIRDNGQMFERPFAAGDFDSRRRRQFEQMPHSGGDHVSVALEAIVPFFETAQRLGDVTGDRRFFGND